MRRWRNILGSTPVRQALGLVAVVTVLLFVTLGVAFIGLHKSTEDTIRTNIAQHFAGFDVAATPSTLSTLVAAEARVADPAQRVFVYIDPQGRSTGNAIARLSRDTVEILPSGGARLSDDGYFSEIENRLGGILVVAEARTPLRQLEETFLAILMFSLGPTILVTLGIAVLIAQRTRRRVEAIEGTLDRLTNGDLTARLDHSRWKEEDLMRIGAGVNRMAKAQEDSTLALRQVSADIAHDLKTPLQRVAVMLHDLRDTLPDGDAADLANRAAEEAETAVSVFRSLLQIAQIESGSPKARFTEVDLGALAEKIGELYVPAAEESGHRIEIIARPAVVSGDAALLGQAMSNLIENALRHTPAGTVISICTGEEDDRPVLRVSDNGPGIPANEREKVLRRLYRLERSRTTTGNGLGLSLVAAVAEVHSAALTLDDAAPGLVVRLSF